MHKSPFHGEFRSGFLFFPTSANHVVLLPLWHLLVAGEGEPVAGADWKKPTPLTSSRVQRHLDQLCVKRFQELCTDEGLQVYCGKTAVARKGRGSVLQEQKEWRCYDDAVLSEDSADVWCTDDCGVLFPCVGSVDPQNSIHTTVESLATELVDRVAEHCSPYQKILNEYCTNLNKSWVARRRVSLGGEETPWRCYDVVGGVQGERAGASSRRVATSTGFLNLM